jgi:hypothetical protein
MRPAARSRWRADRTDRRARVRARGARTRRVGAAAAAVLTAACAADPIRDADFSSDYELHLVAGDGRRTGGARFPSDRSSLAELEAWLKTQVEARRRIEAVEAGIERALLVGLASAMQREFGVRTRIIERSESVRSDLIDELDARMTFARFGSDGLFIVTLATREVPEGEAGGGALEAAARVSLLGPGEAVSDFYDGSEQGALVCAIRRGDAWVQPLDQDCAATMTERVMAAIRRIRDRR